MRSTLSKMIIRAAGWKIIGQFPDIQKAVLIMAPHTSLWDWIWGRLFFFAYRKKTYILIKEKYFFFPLGMILRATGGVPVPCTGDASFMQRLLKLFKEKEDIYLTITPEGTRKKVTNWRTGFYRIASNLEIPVIMGFIDYQKREMGVGPVLHPTGNKDEDLQKVYDFYRNIGAQHPEKFAVPQTKPPILQS